MDDILNITKVGNATITNNTTYTIDEIEKATIIADTSSSSCNHFTKQSLCMMDDGNFVLYFIKGTGNEIETIETSEISEADAVEKLKYATMFDYEGFSYDNLTIKNWLIAEKLGALPPALYYPHFREYMHFRGYHVDDGKLIAFFEDGSRKYQLWYNLDIALGYTMRKALSDIEVLAEYEKEEIYLYIIFEQAPHNVIIENYNGEEVYFADNILYQLAGEPCLRIATTLDKIADMAEQLRDINTDSSTGDNNYEDDYYINHLKEESKRLKEKAILF